MIEVTNLTKRYGPNVAVDDLSFTVRPGVVTGFLGPNGAGKSTTLRMLTTLIAPTSGSASVAGHDVVTGQRDVRRAIGFVGQGNGAGHRQLGRDELVSQGRAHGLSRADARRRAAELVDDLDLAAVADRKVSSLSGGQRRRLDIAMGLVHLPRVLFLDEPSTGLDPQNRANLQDLIRRLHAESGSTVVLTTHYLEEAETLCDRVAIIARGEIAATGSPRDLVRQSTDTPLVELSTVEALPPGIFDGLAELQDLSRDVNGARFRTADAERTVAAVLERLAAQRIHIADLRVRKATLESVFLDLVTTGGDATTTQGPS
jgi:ABC-2 type transport system ATP-binding protein